ILFRFAVDGVAIDRDHHQLRDLIVQVQAARPPLGGGAGAAGGGGALRVKRRGAGSQHHERRQHKGARKAHAETNIAGREKRARVTGTQPRRRALGEPAGGCLFGGFFLALLSRRVTVRTSVCTSAWLFWMTAS